MSIKILSAFVLAFITLNLVSCSQDPAAIGSVFVAKDIINLDSLDSSKDTLLSSSNTYKHIIPLGYSTTLLLGIKDDNVATMLLRFNFSLSDAMKADLRNDSLVVTSAAVQLYQCYTYAAADSTQPVDYTVHSVSPNTTWTSTGFTVDSLPNVLINKNPTDESISSNVPKIFSDSLFQFNISTDLAKSWLLNFANSGTPDNGIVVIPTQNSKKIVGFYALTSSTTVSIPYLVVVVKKPGVYDNDTLKFSTTSDLSVITGNPPQLNPAEDIFVQSSVELESRIKFDLSKVPKNVIINYAELQLTIDLAHSAFGSSNPPDQLTASFITDSTHIDSLSINIIVLTRVGSLYTGNITSYVQNWLSTKINEGIQIRSGTYDTGLELWALKGSNAADPSVRPRLKIIYTNKN